MMSSSLRRRAALQSACRAAVLVVALIAAGCKPEVPQFENVDMTGADYARDFALTDAHGTPRTLESFHGKVVVLFFGYTACPDVCPLTMANLATAMQKLGPDADRVQVLFATLDPERDTPAVLAAYVPNFDPRFLGLYGDAAATVKTAHDFRVFYQKVDGPTPTSYTLNHSANTFVYDPSGHLRLFLRADATPASIAHDIKLLL